MICKFYVEVCRRYVHEFTNYCWCDTSGPTSWCGESGPTSWCGESDPTSCGESDPTSWCGESDPPVGSVNLTHQLVR